GVFSGLIALPSVPAMSLLRNHTGTTPSGSLAVPDEAVRNQGGTQLYQSLSAFYDTLTTQDARRSLTGLTPATQNNIRLLQSVMQSAVVLAQAQTAGNLLTIAVAQAGVPAPVPLSGSGTGAGVDASAPVSLLQSAGDVRAVSHALGQSLDAQVLAFSGQGFTRTALALREARLALVEDLTTRGVHLPGTSSVAVRTTQPALVTLYRATGSSVQWQRFVRRNNVIHPLFVPGGQVLEVIDE
ncbi:multidrug DMT transporter permease, partial [Salmonella enterica]|nr:multidrug DMT transporter permease [Salmonella enterica]